MKKIILLLLGLAATSFTVKAQESEQINQYYKSFLSTDPNAPVTAVLVSLENSDNGFFFRNGFGTHSLESTLEVNENSPFKIASITKMLTATVILQLVESGELHLEDKAYELLKDIAFIKFEELHLYNGSSYGKNITLEQLLRHTSGLADIFTDSEAEFIELFASDPTKQWSPESLFETYYNFDLNSKAHFKPGDGFYYSDTNYFLLGLIIETITKKSLAENYRSKVLVPAGMGNTYFEYHELPPNNEAMPSTYLSNMELDNNINTSFDWAGGGLVSTTKDLSFFMKALFSSKLVKNKSLFDQMITDTGHGYGMGISVYSINDQTFYGHGGYWGSFVCFSPKKEKLLILSTNQSDPSFSFNELVAKSLEFME